MARRAIFTAEAVSGVATVRLAPDPQGRQFTIIPAVDSNDSSTTTGTFTVEAKSPDADLFEDVVDSAGTALSLDLSNGPITRTVSGKFDRIRVTSTESGDEFTVSVR
jgi:hypothetical protein